MTPTPHSVERSLEQAADIAQRVIDAAAQLDGRELLEAAPVVRDLTYLLIKLRPSARSAAAAFAGSRATPIAFTRDDLERALGPAGEWRTRRELRAVLGCSERAFVKWWTEYAAADERYEAKTGGGRGNIALYRLRELKT